MNSDYRFVIFEIVVMGKNQLLTINKPASANRNKYLKRKFVNKYEIENYYEVTIVEAAGVEPASE